MKAYRFVRIKDELVMHRVLYPKWHDNGRTNSRRTRIDVEVRQVEHFEALPARFLWRRQWIGFRLGKPASEVQGGRGWERARSRWNILAQHLE